MIQDPKVKIVCEVGSAQNRFKYIMLYSLADTHSLVNSKIINSRSYKLEASLQTDVPYDDFVLCN